MPTTTKPNLPAVGEGEGVACERHRGERPLHPAAGALHRGQPGEGARGLAASAGRRRTRRSSTRSRTSAATSGRRATRSSRRGPRSRRRSCSSATSRTSSTTTSPRRWKRRSTRSQRGRGRVREVAPLLLLRQRHRRAPRARVRGEPRQDRHERGQQDPRSAVRRRRHRVSWCGSGTPASRCTAATTSARCRPTMPPDELTVERAKELIAKGSGRAPRARRRSRRPARWCSRSTAASVRSCSSACSRRARRRSRRARRSSSRWTPTRSTSRPR